MCKASSNEGLLVNISLVYLYRRNIFFLQLSEILLDIKDKKIEVLY